MIDCVSKGTALFYYIFTSMNIILWGAVILHNIPRNGK
jgi:hypothetical protein